MKEITVNTIIQTLVDVESDFSDRIIPGGSSGTVVECYSNPEGYAVDVAIPDENFVGKFAYENVILMPEQFVVISDAQLYEHSAFYDSSLPDVSISEDFKKENKTEYSGTVHIK